MNRSSPGGGSLLAVLMLLVVFVLGLVVVLNLLAVDRTQHAQVGWDETLGPWDEVMQRYPATEANGVALGLEEIAARLGVDLAPTFSERVSASPEAKKAFVDLKKKVFSRYSSPQLERVRRGEIDPPPPELVDFVNAHARELEDLRRLLLQGDVAVWESDLSRGEAAPIPNLLGHIDLQKTLASVALVELHAGDTAGALRSIEAGWALSRSLRDSPILISQLIYFSGTRLQIGALRHVSDIPEAWVGRLIEHDFRDSFLSALKFEAWFWVHLDHTQLWGGTEAKWWHRLAPATVRRYTELCLADVSESFRQRVSRLEQVAALCDHDLSAQGADLVIDIPRWNKLGGLALPNLSGAVQRVARLELDRELLLLVAEAEAARRSTGSWPAPAVIARGSAACPGDDWVYTRSAEGVEIALSREISWPGQVGTILPPRIIID